MPVAIVEQIALELYTRLESLLVSEGNYETLVSEVVRPTRVGIIPKHGQVVIVQGTSTEVPELSFPGNPPAIARRQIFHIRCHIMNDEESELPLDTLINSFATDIIRCVTTSDDSRWHSFGELAIDAYFLDREYVSGDGGPDGINMPIAITYRTSENDPYTVRG